MFAASRGRAELSNRKVTPLGRVAYVYDESTSAGGDSSDEYNSVDFSSGDSQSTLAESFTQKMPPPPIHYQKVIETSVAANDPTDFATAWNAAAHVSGWKRGEPDPFPKGRKSAARKPNKKTTTSMVVTGDGPCPVSFGIRPVPILPKADDQGHGTPEIHDHRVEDMPLPKFLGAKTFAAPIRGRPQFSDAERTRAAEMLDSALSMLKLVSAKGTSQQAMPSIGFDSQLCMDEEESSASGLSPMYLKIDVPSAGRVASLHDGIPCKKRVPDWGFPAACSSLNRNTPCKKRVPDWGF